MNINKIVIFLLVILVFSACKKYPDKVKKALDLAGKNRSELINVLNHYSQSSSDSLKLQAAYFLIGNMPGKFYYDGKLLSQFYGFVEKDNEQKAIDSLTQLYGAFTLDSLEKKYDLLELKSSFLIDNINMSFKVWKEQPWGKFITFSQFCEYILPYRIGHEIPDNNRAKIYNLYNRYLDSVRTTGGDALKACFAVNNKLISEKRSFSRFTGLLPDFSAKILLTQKKLSCRDMVDKTVFVMRALGIPVGAEFTPNWGNRGGGHIWNVVLDKNGRNHTFMGTENNNSREMEGGVQYTFAKAFLKTFANQNFSSELIEVAGNDAPVFFSDKFMKDVTDESKGSQDIAISLIENKIGTQKIAYICVFDNKNWIPINWGMVSKNKVVFKKMMPDIVYLAAFYKNRQITPINYPFILSKTGKLTFLSPSKTTKIDLILDRKYPIFMKSAYGGRMTGGKFQSADDPTFKNAVTNYTIPYPEIKMKWYDVSVKSSRKYKYYRYLSPIEGWGNIAELQFWSNGKKVSGKVIGSPGSFNNNPDATFASAMDGQESTFFDYNKPANGWVGLQCNIPIKIDKIRFLPRNDDNGIDIGQKYELIYWDIDGWISTGIKIADKNKLVYPKIPGNALYMLRNRTKGNEERFFTYKNGEQVWW